MSEFISQSKFAKLHGITKQAVSQAIKSGRLVRAEKGIDPEHPTNRYFIEKQELKKNPKKPSTEMARLILDSKSGHRSQVDTVKHLAAEVKQLKEQPPEPREKRWTAEEKDRQATRLTTIKADRELLKYAREVEILVDNETLRRKMGRFMDFLLTSLVDFPGENSDILWMRAADADDPAREIREFLEGRLGDVIKKAKLAAAELEPPDSDVKYVMLQVDEEQVGEAK